jgi:hypothetical protein
MAHNQTTTTTASTARTNLNTLLARVQTQIAEIAEYDGPFINYDQEQEPEGLLYQALQPNNGIFTYTNLTPDVLMDFYQSMQPFIADAGKRGPNCKSSSMDQLLCYLVWGKLGAEYDKLGAQFKIKKGRFQQNVDRIRPIINKTLRFRWWTPRMRPKFQDEADFPHVALLIDSHTSHTYRPKAKFGEAKIYWDGHHKIYGYKNEVALMAAKPHYCLFVQQNEVGSVHDYQDLKNHYQTYLEYLLKQPEEMHHLQGDLQHRYWATALDRAYVGPATDTPDFRRVTPKKGRSLSIAETRYNTKISVFRVPIEQYFGRLVQLWGVPRGIYRWDHSHFQTDFENFCLLTNENIKVLYLALVIYLCFTSSTHRS